MASVHPHLLFAKELSVLADIHHPNITGSNPKKQGRRKKNNKAQQSVRGGGGVTGGGRGRGRGGLEKASIGGKSECQVKLVDTEKKKG